MLKNKTVAFIGTGFMGQALMRGMIKSGAVAPKQIVISDTNERVLKDVAGQLKVKVAKSNGDAVDGADLVILAVKPQMLSSVTRALGRKLGKKRLVISIAAGVTTNTLIDLLPNGARIIRVMPNIAATVSESASALCPGGASNDMDVAMARQIFDSVGESVLVDESAMDAVTGLSGSGPAFVFAFLDSLIDAGVRCGLSREIATQLAKQTVYGSAKLARDAGETPASLKDQVTSPGGTTIAGLSVLDDRAFKGAIVRAVEAAWNRSKELGGK